MRKIIIVLLLFCGLLYSQTSDRINVKITNPADGSFLVYQSATRKWIDGTGGSFVDLTISGDLTLSAHTAGRVLYTGVGGLVSSDANFLYDGLDLTLGTDIDDVQPTFSIIGDADSDAGGDTSETLALTLTPNADPTLSTWGFTSTQSLGYTFDRYTKVTGSATGLLLFEVDNASAAASTVVGASMRVTNDNDYYGSMGITNSGTTFGAGAFNNSVHWYSQGYNDNLYTVDGNKDHVWYTDPTDSHDYSALSNEVMRLEADGDLVLVATNKLYFGGDTYQSETTADVFDTYIGGVEATYTEDTDLTFDVDDVNFWKADVTNDDFDLLGDLNLQFPIELLEDNTTVLANTNSASSADGTTIGSYITVEDTNVLGVLGSSAGGGSADEFRVDINGGLSGQIITCTITANAYTVIGTDYHINVDDDVDATGNVTINLPAVATNTGRILHIKKIGNSYNVILDGNASEEIDDATTQTMTSQYDSITIMCDGTAWWIQ